MRYLLKPVIMTKFVFIDNLFISGVMLLNAHLSVLSVILLYLKSWYQILYFILD